ncbi:hypothetical protein [Undibacterium sp.]
MKTLTLALSRTRERGWCHSFHGLGHAPQMEDPDGFHKALLAGLQAVK